MQEVSQIQGFIISVALQYIGSYEMVTKRKRLLLIKCLAAGDHTGWGDWILDSRRRSYMLHAPVVVAEQLELVCVSDVMYSEG